MKIDFLLALHKFTFASYKMARLLWFVCQISPKTKAVVIKTFIIELVE